MIKLFNREPPRINDRAKLNPKFNAKLHSVLKDMQDAGYDPVVIETLRTQKRQTYLYSIGRTYKKGSPVVTWTLTNSKHLTGNAADIISKKHGYNSIPFYEALARLSKKHGLTTLTKERCHVQMPF